VWVFLVICSQGDSDNKGKHYSKEKIISILKEHEAGSVTNHLGDE